ncbi:MAG: hypothetical protein HY553_21305 [Elusimicrobia bacterium]|nr:hypothetical protein [Elusimicrobiota bacterium]
MTPWQKVFAGCVFFALGLGYLYRPDLIERMNALLREYVLNDAHLALERRKWGMFFLLLSFLFLYMGYTALNRGVFQ